METAIVIGAGILIGLALVLIGMIVMWLISRHNPRK